MNRILLNGIRFDRVWLAHRLICLLGLFLSLVGVCHGENLYLQQTGTIHITEEMLAEAEDKIGKTEKKEIRTLLAVTPFHERNALKPVPEGVFCVDCHSSMPHSENERQRSFLNMHVGSIHCTTCHYRPDGVQLTYDWQSVEDSTLDNSRRIAPFYQTEAISIASEHPFAIDIQRQMEDATLQEKARIYLKLHGPLEKKGPLCKECHDRDQHFLDLVLLGLEEEEIRSITDNRIARFLGREAQEDERLQLRDLLQ